MNKQSIALLVIIGIAFIYAVYVMIKNKNKCCNCQNCDKCRNRCDIKK